MGSNTDYRFAAPGCNGVQPDHHAAAHLRILDHENGRVDWFGGGRKRLALCGFASSSRARIPIDDPSWILVGLNQLYRHIDRADAWFDIHVNWEEDNVEGTDHKGWIEQCGIPVFMAHRDPSLATTVNFPNEGLIKYFDCDYSTSTVAHILELFLFEIDQDVRRRLAAIPAVQLAQNGSATALDVYELARTMYREYEIGIFGIDLVVGTEYEFQRQCAEFWIGECESRGITMTIPPESALLKQTHRYGFQREPEGSPLKTSEVSKRLGQANAKRGQLVSNLQMLDGVIHELDMLQQVMTLRQRGAQIAIPDA